MFRKLVERPTIDGHINLKNLKALASEILLKAVEAIQSRKVNTNEKTDWAKDVWWLHNPESNYTLWCEIIELDPKHLRNRYPVSLIQPKTKKRRRPRKKKP